MQSIVKTLLTSLATSAVLVAGLAIAKDDFPQTTVEGLERVKDSNLSVVYVEPGADFSVYGKFIVLEPAVAFKKNWLRDQNRSRGNRVRESDMEAIKVKLATEFNEVFVEVLEADDGYPVVETVADDTLIIRPAIINLDVQAPATNTAGRSYTMTDSAGEMTLYIELYDSVTGDLIAKAVDRRADYSGHYMSWQSSVANKQAARKILKGWAQVLRDGLDEARAAGSGGTE